MDALRTFVRGIDLGSFAKAADAAGRSRAAVSGQLRKLEAQIGAPLMRKAGRGLTPTSDGEEVLAYARRILDLNDRAVGIVRASRRDDVVRLGLPPDRAETWLPRSLASFAHRHPRAHVEIWSDRSSALTERVADGRLDVALAWGLDATAGRAVAEVPVGWLVRAGDGAGGAAARPLNLVAFDEPCLFRRLGLAALQEAGIDWRIGVTTPDLSGLWGAVAAGIGVTMRTRIGLPPSIAFMEPRSIDLPPLPPVTLSLHQAADPSALATAFSEMVVERAELLG